MKKLIIMRGLPGSGKSTYASNLLKKYIDLGYTATKFESDDYFIGEDGVYRWKKELQPIALKWCQDKVRNALNYCDIVIVANTNLSKEIVDIYVNMAKEIGAEYQIIRMNNDFGDIHGVPAETKASMASILVPYEGEIVIEY